MATAELETVTADLETNRTKVSSTAAQLEVMEIERNRLAAQVDRMYSDLDEVRRREQRALSLLDEVELDRVRLTSQFDELQLEVADERGLNRRVRNEAAQTIQRSQGRAMRAVARNTSAGYLEMIPLLGTAAAVGGIAYDVWDTCQAVSELREIGRLFEIDTAPDPLEQRWCGLTSEEVFAAIFNGATGPERACISARLRTGELNPPGCEDYLLESGSFAVSLPPSELLAQPIEPNPFE